VLRGCALFTIGMDQTTESNCQEMGPCRSQCKILFDSAANLSSKTIDREGEIILQRNIQYAQGERDTAELGHYTSHFDHPSGFAVNSLSKGAIGII